MHFFIDVAKELLVLYENVYEIYGDIRGASNSFRYKFYAQGKYRNYYFFFILQLNCNSNLQGTENFVRITWVSNYVSFELREFLFYI